MAFCFRSSLELDFDLLDASGEHCRGEKTIIIGESGKRRSLSNYINEGLTPPSECIDDLPKAIRVHNAANIGFTGSFSMFICDDLTYELFSIFTVPSFSYIIPTSVHIDGVHTSGKWRLIQFSLLDEAEHIFDLSRSDLDWGTATPSSQKTGLLPTIKFGSPKLAVVASRIKNLSIWRGGGGGQLRGAYFCSDAFREAWDRSGLVGMKFECVEEVV